MSATQVQVSTFKTGERIYRFYRTAKCKIFEAIDAAGNVQTREVFEGESLTAAFRSLVMASDGMDAELTVQEHAFRAGYLVGQWDAKYASSRKDKLV